MKRVHVEDVQSIAPELKSSSYVKVKILRTFPTITRENCRTRRLQLVEEQVRADGSRSHGDFYCDLSGVWTEMEVEANFVMEFRSTPVKPSTNSSSPLNHKLRMVLDETQDSAHAEVRVWTPNGIIMGKSPQVYTLSSLLADIGAEPLITSAPAASSAQRNSGATTFVSASALADANADTAGGVSGPPRKKMKGAKKAQVHVYTPLGSISAGKHDIVGVVKDYTPVKKTRGSDYMVSINITDRTIPNNQVALNIFGDKGNLPCVLQVGDILRMHRVDFKVWQGTTQGVCNIKKGASFILLHGAMSDSLEPYAKSSPNFQLVDVEMMMSLRQWGKEMLQSLEMGRETTRKHFEDLNITQYCDIACQVLGIQRPSSGSHAVLYVWDGTDLPLKLTDNIADFKHNVPKYGSVVPITVPSDIIDLLDRVKVRSWVQLRNLSVEVKGTEIVFKLTHISRGSTLRDELPAVRQLLKMYEARCEKERSAAESKSVIRTEPAATTTHLDWPIFPVKSVINHHTAVGKFRVRVRVVGHTPLDVSEFVCLHCQRCNRVQRCDVDELETCEVCSEPARHVYLFKLTVEDLSGSIDVALFNHDANAFFQVIPPVNLHTNNMSKQAVEKRINLLRQPGVWIDCCISSYQPESSDGCRGRRYRMFDTMLVHSVD